MCGIAGNYFFKEQEGAAYEHASNCLTSALNTMKHRGPDHHEVVRSGPYLMAHTRLSIIDTSATANQPMMDESGRYSIVFNGEIFNFKQLRSDLMKEGINFHTDSDTEVLLHMLIRFGKECLNKQNGFFAIAFYDRNEHSLLLARDRFGVKPLYFFVDKNRCCFASELRALMKLEIPCDLNQSALWNFFALSYIPAPDTIFGGITRLMPGELLEVNVNGNSSSKWYQPVIENSKLSFGSAAEHLKNLLDDAVKIRLISDVPVGCFLSGGMDSSIVAALAARHHQGLQTFSVGFPDHKYFDETPFATEVANHIKSRHHVIPLYSDDFAGNIDLILQSQDEPFADPSAIAYFILAKNVRPHVTVALSGDGADELFAGYNKHEALRRSMDGNWSDTLMKLISGASGLLPSGRSGAPHNKIRQLRKYTEGLNIPLPERYWKWALFTDEDVVDQLFLNASSTRDVIGNSVKRMISADFNSMLRADQALVLANDMLVKSDSMSMANSLEVRTPFLDYRVVELANDLPVSFKINAQGRKLILRESFGKMLPGSVFTRKKRGFEVPLESLLRNEFKQKLSDAFALELLRNQAIFDPRTCIRLHQDFVKNKNNDLTSVMWSMLVFQSWVKSIEQ